MDLSIGSNIYRNANGVLRVQGKEQLVLETRSDGRQLLLTMDLYDSKGEHIAHLRRNVWAFNRDERFQIAIDPTEPTLFTKLGWLRLIDVQTGESALEAHLIGTDKVQILKGTFHTHKGQLLEITSHLFRISGSVTMFGDVLDVRGGVVAIG